MSPFLLGRKRAKLRRGSARPIGIQPHIFGPGKAVFQLYLHLGRDIVVPRQSIVAVMDMDTATASRYTRAFLSVAEQQGQVVMVSDDLPRSAVLCTEAGGAVVYITQISSRTLLKRADEL